MLHIVHKYYIHILCELQDEIMANCRCWQVPFCATGHAGKVIEALHIFIN